MTVKKRSSAQPAVSTQAQTWIDLARLRFEKCELYEAEMAYVCALKSAKKVGDLKRTMEALGGLLRLAGEALNDIAHAKWEAELDSCMAKHPDQIPPYAYYCKGAAARHRDDSRQTLAYFRKYLSELSRQPDFPEKEAMEARGWVSIGMIYCSERSEFKRARLLAQALLVRYEAKNLRGVNGLIYLMLGIVEMKRKSFVEAQSWYEKSHASFLGEHNWFYHLYVLYGYARIHRMQQNYREAYWYLDLVDRAASTPQFGALRKEVAAERSRLEQAAVDLLIDGRAAVIRTRESGDISLRKQYTLLHILEALTHAHRREGDDMERGLSKAEIIQHVWKENYRPESHDNKLYYNINRLRKLIEPDVKNPQYLLNWKEGYRLAPGLRVQFVGGHKSLRHQKVTHTKERV